MSCVILYLDYLAEVLYQNKTTTALCFAQYPLKNLLDILKHILLLLLVEAVSMTYFMDLVS